VRQQPQNYNTPIVVMSAVGGRDKTGIDSSDLKITAWIENPPDIGRLAKILERAVARDTNGWPRVLHVDDDQQVLELVARALSATATVVSAGSLEDARSALMTHQFDLAILDVGLGAASGLDLLPELRNREGIPIPVIVFSAHAAELAANPLVEANLDKASTSLKDLVTAVHDRLLLKSSSAKEVV